MEFLQFASIAAIDGLRHAVTTRHGGVGAGDYADFNLAFHVGDEPGAVRENRRRLAQAVGLALECIISAQQVHGSHVQIASGAQRGCGSADWESAIADTDGLIVAEPGVAPLILVADCAPVLLVDPVQRVLAVVHAGWRGAVAGIAGCAVEIMGESCGSQPDALRAGIGPCLCVACLEVGAEVAELRSTVVVPGAARPHLDLRAMLCADLVARGVPRASIETMPHCPRCDMVRFFSHRGEQGKTGRFGLLAWWD